MPTKSKSTRLPASRPSSKKPAAAASNGNGAKSAKPSGGKKTKYVYTWGNNKADGDGSMKPLLGGKGANLAEMTRIGLPVPPGFTITTEVCTYFYAQQKDLPARNCRRRWRRASRNMEKIMGTKFGATECHAAARRRALRRARFHARHDGHRS